MYTWFSGSCETWNLVMNRKDSIACSNQRNDRKASFPIYMIVRLVRSYSSAGTITAEKTSLVAVTTGSGWLRHFASSCTKGLHSP